MPGLLDARVTNREVRKIDRWAKTMILRWYGVGLLVVLGCIGIGQEAETTLPETFRSASLTIEQAIPEAVQNNLTLLAERMNLTIAEAALITASLRPNPVLSLNADHQDFLGTGFSRHDGAGPQEFSWRVDVPIERGVLL